MGKQVVGGGGVVLYAKARNGSGFLPVQIDEVTGQLLTSGTGGGGTTNPSTIQFEHVVGPSALSGHRVVVPTTDGTLEYATNTNSAHVTLPIWLTMAAGAAGGTITLLAMGNITEPSWNWTPGEAVYLGVDGNLTQVVPTAPSAHFLLQVASATTATTIMFSPRTPIVL